MSKKKTNNIEQRINDRSVLKNFAEGKKWSELIDVSKLIEDKNNPKEFLNVLGGEATKNPGCYKWWAKKDDIEELLSKKLSLDENLKKLFSETESSQIFEKEEKENLYCIYVGKANDLYDRLRNHAKKTEQSTLRRTICSLTCNQDDTLEKINSTIDEWLNKFKLQYFSLCQQDRIKDTSGKQTIYKLKGIKRKEKKDNLSLLDLEYFFINEKFHILNVDENHYVEYTKKENQLDEETVEAIEKIKKDLSEKKKEWPKETIVDKKKKN